MVEISVTNLTRGQTFSPVFVVRHDRNAAPLYELGQPPSEALANLAEDGSAAGFLSELSPDTNSSVGEARAISGLLAPGQTATAEFSITDGKKLLSLASMLVSTNDAFFGANALGPFQISHVLPERLRRRQRGQQRGLRIRTGTTLWQPRRQRHFSERRRLCPCTRRHPRRRRPRSSPSMTGATRAPD